MNVPFEEATEMAPERLGQDKAYTIDSTKIRTELTWNQKISLEEGVNQTVNWVNSHFDAINQHPLQYIHKA